MGKREGRQGKGGIQEETCLIIFPYSSCPPCPPCPSAGYLYQP